jgi:hypothetical protein
VAPRYPDVRELAIRLLRGEVVQLEDEHGRRWRGEAGRLLVVLPGNGEAAAVLEGDAFDVAERLADLTRRG